MLTSRLLGRAGRYRSGADVPLHHYRRVETSAERIALAKDEDSISADTFNQTAPERVELVRRKEQQEVA